MTVFGGVLLLDVSVGSQLFAAVSCTETTFGNNIVETVEKDWWGITQPLLYTRHDHLVRSSPRSLLCYDVLANYCENPWHSAYQMCQMHTKGWWWWPINLATQGSTNCIHGHAEDPMHFWYRQDSKFKSQPSKLSLPGLLFEAYFVSREGTLVQGMETGWFPNL